MFPPPNGMELMLSIQLAAIETSFIQLKPKLVKSLSSQLQEQHPSAGERVCDQGGAARTCHPRSHRASSTHSPSYRVILAGAASSWATEVPGAVHGALSVPASLHLCSLQLCFGKPWQPQQPGVTLLFHGVPVPC